MPASSNLPVACTLDQRRYDERLARNHALARLLIDRQRDRLRLTLTYPRNAAPDVHRMVAAERECCAFIDFDVRESTDTIAVTMTLPETATAVADEVFAQFAPASTAPRAPAPRRMIRAAQWEAVLLAAFVIGAAWASVLWQTRRRAVQSYTGRREEPTSGSSPSDVSA